MQIRLAHPNDLGRIMTIIEEARQFITSYGSDQWQNTYPDVMTISDDIIEGRGYVAIIEQEVVAYTAVVKGPDKAYESIYDGQWLNASQTYQAFHRLAVADAFRGQEVASTLLEGLMDMQDEIDFRCDTHPDNLIMKRLLQKLRFTYCGKVMYEGERLAYQLLKTEKNVAPITYLSEGGD